MALRNRWLRALAGFALGLLLFFAIAWALKRVVGPIVTKSAVASQIVLKSGLIVAALAIWRLLGRSFSAMGWQKARWWSRSYLPWLLLAVVSMMAGSVVVILLGVRHPVASQMTFVQIIVFVWILSSFSEEIYVRGLVQSWIANDEKDVASTDSLLDPSIVASALLFGALHVSLLWTPLGMWGGLAIVLATLGVGYACAVLRARSRSLWPAIACHVIGNVAGIPGGILGMIVYRLVYGHFPALP